MNLNMGFTHRSAFVCTSIRAKNAHLEYIGIIYLFMFLFFREHFRRIKSYKYITWGGGSTRPRPPEKQGFPFFTKKGKSFFSHKHKIC